jgi:outer membrane receptor protein involved in Fe transport
MRGYSARNRLNRLLGATGMALGLLTASVGSAAEPITFAIKAQPLDAAIRDFAAQAHLDLELPSEVAHGIGSLNGRYTPADGIKALLEGSGLEFEFVAPKTLIVRPRSRRQIQEIVVTAQHKSEDISKVPMAISALTGDQMEQEGLRSIKDIAREVPGLNFQSAGDSFGSTEISIRGVLATAGAATTGIYINDTPIQVGISGFTATNNPYPQVFDLDRIEVLKGPQGTLFGGSSEGGTVRFITPEPSLDKWSGTARVDTSFIDGGDASGEAGAAIGGPIIEDVLGFRLSAWLQHEGGWVDRVDYKTGATVDPNSNWDETKVVRLSFKFAPTDRLTITPAVFYQDKYTHDTGLWWLDNGAYSPANGSPPPLNDWGRYKNLAQLQQPDDDHFWLTSLNIDYRFDAFSVKSITSWFQREDNHYVDESTWDLSTFVPSNFNGYGFQTLGGLYLPGGEFFRATGFFQNNQQNFNQEIRASSNDEPGDWLTWNVGIYWHEDRGGLENTEAEPLINVANDPVVYQNYGYAKANPNTGAPPCKLGKCTVADLMGIGMIGPYTYLDNSVSHDAETAIYANIAVHPIEDLTLQAGVRGSRSTYDFVDIQNGAWNAHQLANGQWTGYGSDQASGKEYPITPRFSASYQLTEDQMIYATAAEGYRPGGGNDNLGDLVSCKPDFQNLGTSGNPEHYNSDTVWSYEFGTKGKFFDKSLELDASVFWLNWNNIQTQVLLPICGYTYTANLGSATSKGFEATLRWIATDWLTLSGNIGYTDARYTTTTLAAPVTANNPDPPILAQAGDTLLTPPLTIALSVEHNEDLADDLSLYARSDLTWASHYNRTASDAVYTNDPILRPGLATTTLGARVGVIKGPWDISVYGQNLLNAGTPTYLYHDSYYSPGVRAESLTPRTIGLTAEYHF